MQVRWQVEIDPFCRRVLEKHWPDVRRYQDVQVVHHRSHFDHARCDMCLSAVDVLCGGFPCQDISPAGRRAGIDGGRSGLWREYARLIGELRPRYAIVENSADLLLRGMGRVCGDLADLRYDAEWDVVSACAFGAPHTRERVFLVAYPEGQRGLQRGWVQWNAFREAQRHLYQWSSESLPARVADGIPNRMDRVHACGNAIVPQIAEWIGRRILEAEAEMRAA